MAVDNDRFMEFLGRFVGDLGATIAAGNVVVGQRLGLYQALAEGPPPRTNSPSGRADAALRHRVAARAGRGRLRRVRPRRRETTRSPRSRRSPCRPEQPGLRPGAFVLALGTLKAEPQITEAFRTGERRRLARARRRRLRRLRAVLPARLHRQPVTELDPGARRRRGEARARAPASPTSAAASARRPSSWRRPTRPRRSPGPTTTTARSSWPASGRPRPGVAERVSFEVARRQTFGGTGYDLVTTFDCLHDMGDPLGAARHVREALAPTAPG